jgi:hypothetical protein
MTIGTPVYGSASAETSGVSLPVPGSELCQDGLRQKTLSPPPPSNPTTLGGSSTTPGATSTFVAVSPPGRRDRGASIVDVVQDRSTANRCSMRSVRRNARSAERGTNPLSYKGAGVGWPLTGRARVLARRKDVPSLQRYSGHSIDKHARLREQRIAGTRSLPALGPAPAMRLPD